MRKIKASSLVPGSNYHFALYGDKSAIMPCKVISRPETQIGLMADNDRFVIQKENGETILFRRNNCEPYFLVTDVPGKRDGSFVQDRVVFFGEDLPPKEPKKRGPKPKDVVEQTAVVQEVVPEPVVEVSSESRSSSRKPLTAEQKARKNELARQRRAAAKAG